MLKKCLKYDLKAVFRIWWIAAVSVLGLSVLCGFCLRRLMESIGKERFVFAEPMVVVFSVIALIAFVIVTQILIYIRFYSNFFTDEGYLTFTLPVKRKTLFLSKVINGMVWQFATLLVVGVVLVIVLAMAPDIEGDHGSLLMSVLNAIGQFWTSLTDAAGALAYVYALEAAVSVILSTLVQMLAVFLCITLGAVIAKKQKILAAIGLYYGYNAVSSMVMELINAMILGWMYSGAQAYRADILGDSISSLLGIMSLEMVGIAAGQSSFEGFVGIVLADLLRLLLNAMVATVLGYATLGNLERKLNLQ